MNIAVLCGKQPTLFIFKAHIVPCLEMGTRSDAKLRDVRHLLSLNKEYACDKYVLIYCEENQTVTQEEFIYTLLEERGNNLKT